MAALCVLRSVRTALSAAQCAISNSLTSRTLSAPQLSFFGCTSSRGIRQVVEKQEGKTTVIEGLTVAAPESPQPPNPTAKCPIYRWNLQNKYTYTVQSSVLESQTNTRFRSELLQKLRPQIHGRSLPRQRH